MSKQPPKGAVQPKRRYEVELAYTQDVFVSDVQQTWKDLGHKQQRLPVAFEHKHVFRSVDRKGVACDRTPTKNGHFHFIEWGTDDEGNLVVKKCGPAMYYQERKNERGKVVSKVAKPIQYFRHNGNQATDAHTHSFSYLRSFDYSTAEHNKQKARDQAQYKKHFARHDQEAAARVAASAAHEEEAPATDEVKDA